MMFMKYKMKSKKYHTTVDIEFIPNLNLFIYIFVISLFKSVRSARGVVCVFVVGYLYLYYHRCSFNSYK